MNVFKLLSIHCLQTNRIIFRTFFSFSLLSKWYKNSLRILLKFQDDKFLSRWLSYILLIREAKPLDLFLRKFCERSVKFGTVIDYIEEKCRMLIFFFEVMPKITKINHNLKCWAG